MTEDRGWDVSPSWQDLKAENEELRKIIAQLGKENREIMAERDALEADRDNWKFTYEALRNKYDARTGTVRAYEQSFKNLSDDCDALARRLEKTERAVREMRDERNAAVDRADALAAHVERMREKLRRQASGDDS